MLTRRGFLQTTGLASAAAVAAFRDDGLARLEAAERRVGGGTANDVARDETYWREIQQAFTLDRTIINLNNGGVCSEPARRARGAQALSRHLEPGARVPHVADSRAEHRERAAPAGGRVRRAIPRRWPSRATPARRCRSRSSASTSKPGDEVVTTNQDYGRMLDTWEQRVRRDGIKLTQVSFPVPPKSMDVLAERLLGAITPATKVLHFCHITNLTGQIFPVKRIADEARRRGIKTIVDGAHAFAHFPFTVADLGCDFYGTSLHKWLLAPIGTGFLYVRRENIAGLWPLTPAAESRGDNIRKFEEIGTHPAANHNAIAEALTFHDGIGVERKAARLRYLRNRWAERLGASSKFRIHTNLDPAQSCAIGNIQVIGVPTSKVVAQLWEKWRIIATPINHAEYKGIRVTPNVYTTLEEVDTFTQAMEKVGWGWT